MTETTGIAPKVRAETTRKIPSAAARAVVLSALSRLRNGAVLVSERGEERLYGRPVPGEVLPRLEVHSPLLYQAVLREGSAGLGRAYFSSYFDCPDSDQLVALLRVLARNLERFESGSRLRRLESRARRALGARQLRPGNPSVDKANIVAHYDLSNALYETFLDETMSYSAAIFGEDFPTLELAQSHKLDVLCKKLELSAADHLLEIGTGWGAMALHAAKHYGCRVTTTTISDRQFEYACQAVKQAGLEDLIEVRAQDYRELDGRYDKLVSIEMIEALDWRQYETFFAKCAALLADDGLMALQAITIADRYYEAAKHGSDFIKAYVFPGSCIPSLATLVTHGAAADLTAVGLEDIGAHYVETLKSWRTRFEGRRARVGELGFNEAFFRLYQFYFAYCEAGFAERRISDVQLVLAKANWRPKPLF